MPLAYCAGTCGRMISISSIPGGNPEALAHPESFAVHYQACPGCRKLWCDRCAGATCSCGARLAAHGRDDVLARYDPGSRALQRIAEIAVPEPAAVAAAPVADGPRFLTAAPLDPLHVEKLELVRRAKAAAHRPPDAIRLLDQALALDARCPEALALRGWFHQLCGQRTEAERDFRAALACASPTWPYRRAVSDEL